MRTLLIVISLICTLTNLALFWDWADRGHTTFAVAAILNAALGLFVAGLLRRLRF